MGYKSEVLVGSEWATNAVVWPDATSALLAGENLMERWLLVLEYRYVEVDEVPNRPTWREWIAVNGLPPRSVQL